MAKLQLKHAGIILAAGASSRMGSPKALLQAPTNLPLAEHQARVLEAAGASSVSIVLGCDGEAIAKKLEASHATIVQNPHWQTGRLSSLQAGIRASAADAFGLLILPVDSAGISADTIRKIFLAAESLRVEAVRPEYQGMPGRILWISRNLAQNALNLKSDPGFRLDDWIRPFARAIPVSDANILNNINTPEEWRRIAPLLS